MKFEPSGYRWDEWVAAAAILAGVWLALLVLRLLVGEGD